MKRKRLFDSIRRRMRKTGQNSVAAYLKRPNFTVSGNRELFAEGRIHIESYGRELIGFTASGSRVRVCGRELTMSFYNPHTLRICGVLASIEWE